MEVPDRIEIEGGELLTLRWGDGTITRIRAAALRAACHCASCIGETGSGSWIGDVSTVRILDAHIVGAYGLNLEFAPDHHHTGIFDYDRLRLLGESTGGSDI